MPNGRRIPVGTKEGNTEKRKEGIQSNYFKNVNLGTLSLAWWSTPVIPAFRKQESFVEFTPNLGYSVRLCLENKTTKK